MLLSFVIGLLVGLIGGFFLLLQYGRWLHREDFVADNYQRLAPLLTAPNGEKLLVKMMEEGVMPWFAPHSPSTWKCYKCMGITDDKHCIRVGLCPHCGYNHAADAAAIVKEKAA